MRQPDPFRYPEQRHVRRHGPLGYATHGKYRDWLRDEFGFRCVFCLIREQWTQVGSNFDIDHFQPQALRPDLVTDYDNLLYTCRTCNANKSSRLIPDPHGNVYGKCLVVNDEGEILPLCAEGEILIDELDLDSPSRTAFRKRWIINIQMAVDVLRQDVLKDVMGLPQVLPDLIKLKPPGGNSRLQGLSNSWLARRNAGSEPAIVE